jgi:hypothetical protein
VIHFVGVGRTAGPSTSGPTITHEQPPSHIVQHTGEEEVHDEAMEEPEEEVDDEAVEASEDDNSESDHNGDGEEPSGESLHSQDTPRRGGELWNTSDDSNDESYDPDKPSDADEGLEELELSSQEEEEESIDSQEILLGNENADWNTTQEGDVEVMGPSTAPESIPVVGVVDNAQVEVEHMLSERIEVETHVSTVVGASNSEVLPTAAAAVRTESSTLLFGWAMAGRGFTEGANRLYYYWEGVKYCRLGEEEQYTYEQVTSVLQGRLDVDRVPSPLVDAMVPER